ncbi:hypothetical protein BDZ90DRAFT_234998 [Jaminaea rosea]|uniref:Uncharacterized protein n=1 Tax=Jaminaea rosea TaxID=1569628 RepID=A0A316UGQ4_9BASI|nr:hypothetical protein BDZ90DRAFT_234998 [Jaminaea rosea]PWN24442.1 hypothetical protein BDZ90DRAFT_234998 [Jaminaea rosea]
MTSLCCQSGLAVCDGCRSLLTVFPLFPMNIAVVFLAVIFLNLTISSFPPTPHP